MKRWWYPPILTYHRIEPAPRKETPTLSPETFDRQMGLLSKRWKTVSLSELFRRLERNSPFGGREVALTFDDGTGDAFLHAFPILRKHRIPATIFLIAADIGKPGMLSQPQIRLMQEAGISFGSHTLHHAYLPDLTPERALEELAGSRKLLRSLGIEAEFLSYPAGGFTPEVVRMAKEAGYRGALTTNRGERRFPVDRWALRRITMHSGGSSPFGIWLRCSGYYGLNHHLRPSA
ncbi:MAG: polysaccharide deacetylase family protein [Candidatus Omnitrophica bacterium]|nr:polysaccharide deacetylase family protein [Candidatus Omnitrophota bacterium]